MPHTLPNQLIIMSDEHSRKVLKCYGNSVVETPNIDRLAARGTLFENAYTSVPICVPARATFATGQYGHATGHWDNATPYNGEPDSWGHALQEAGIDVGSIGKLHYRNAEDPTGLDFQEIPMHVMNGIGDVLGCVREPLPKRWKSQNLALNIGAGRTDYSEYDKHISERAIEWITTRATNDNPWVLFVSFICPHFPLIAPEEFFALYDGKGLMPTKPRSVPEHPWLAAQRECFAYDNFNEERVGTALAAYYGLVTFIDSLVGSILDALDRAGLTEKTIVYYLSDHGDNMGERDMWGKSNMYEESVGIPIVISGPNVSRDHVCRTPVSLIDMHPTILNAAGLKAASNRPGSSLLEIACRDDDADRAVFSEYHAMGSISGAFMLRKGKWKLIYYVGLLPELYDLTTDPEELFNLGQAAEYATVRAELEKELRLICDPEQIDAQAKAAQRKIIEQHGGVDAVVEKGGFGGTPVPN
ncbi:sulfatase-like hydrolase/transferase [Yoonia sediminilitoris]|uniref:Choline-sulfatase n=1 Tax=Yoonia sediminilitoris TaxID=1286148 RepID=A0A2T6KG98_9RHOB|nr:sulfatase-like hydrolase/transferase [Yoonia sediminilitoris]PUB14324.1 choline-sulfatase [Yoonia sediminilitoris]RCW95255.1 choline-sulfatase [Yoonia sediminilitoris]